MASEKDVQFVVITPEQMVVEGSSPAVTIPAHDGEVGILAGRAPLMCELGVGHLRYRDGGNARRVFIDGGFAQVYRNHVTVLTERAAPADEITDEMVTQAEQDAQQAETGEARTRARRRATVLRDLRR